MAKVLGLGCMRLSTAPDRDEARAVRVIHAALDAGATLLDTADAYCHDESDVGHNERLIAAALHSWTGDRTCIEVATKGGLRRPRGDWVNDGRARSIGAACEASRRSLGVDVIDLYQLHAVDPKTPFETSVRALADLQGEGKIRKVGLCNVTVGQIESARRVVEIASVQVSLSPLDDGYLRNGVAEYCRDHGIRLIAYRPLGGERRRSLIRDAVLAEVAAERGASAEEVILAWLMDLGAVPIPGATRAETAESLGRALSVELTDDDRKRLDRRFSGRLLRIPRAQRRPPDGASGEVVLVMGMPGAGKSSVSREFVARGYSRLNRDERGGSLSDLLPELDAGLAAGSRRWVLDNTYPSRRARNEVVETAWSHGIPARCVWLTTSVADAQINAISRLLATHGRLPMPAEIRALGKHDPRFFGPDAQFKYERMLEPPTADEGFTAIEAREFARATNVTATRRAVILEYDDVTSSSATDAGPALHPDDVVLVPGVREVLASYQAEGWLLFAHAWRPQITRGELTTEECERCFSRTRELLGFDLAMAHCPHDAGPPICWCRKPLPGLVLAFALPNDVALDRSVGVGRGAADRTMAQRLGLAYLEPDAFVARGIRDRESGTRSGD